MRQTRARVSGVSDCKGQEGYAILLVLFLATLMVLATMAVVPNVKTQIQRERELEMIWRGKQYVRGIKMYYRKTGKFPTSLEDLTKPKIANRRFMRQAYKDPMNSKDGEWRLIYVGPSGQLIGSLKAQRALQLTGIGGFQGIGGAPGGIGQPVAPQFGQSFGQQPAQGLGGLGGGLGGPGTSSLGGFGQSNSSSSFGANSAASGVSADTNQPGGLTSSDENADAANEALLNSDPPKIMGGNIIGVGSKINQRSIIVYDKAKNYRQFEFIWNPSNDVVQVGGIPGAPPSGVLPIGQQPGQFGATSAPGGINPGGAVPAPNPNGPGSGPGDVPLSQPPPETTPNPPPQP